MKMKLTKQISYLVRYLGWGLGSVLGVLFGSAMLKMQGEYKCAEIERSAKREAAVLNWTTEISPAVLKATDKYGFDHLCRRRPDAVNLTNAPNVFLRMATIAGQFYYDQFLEGRSITEIRVTQDMSTLNRVTEVASSFKIVPKPDGKFDVIHPATEQIRLKDLDRAMKRFLN